MYLRANASVVRVKIGGRREPSETNKLRAMSRKLTVAPHPAPSAVLMAADDPVAR